VKNKERKGGLRRGKNGEGKETNRNRSREGGVGHRQGWCPYSGGSAKKQDNAEQRGGKSEFVLQKRNGEDLVTEVKGKKRKSAGDGAHQLIKGK